MPKFSHQQGESIESTTKLKQQQNQSLINNLMSNSTNCDLLLMNLIPNNQETMIIHRASPSTASSGLGLSLEGDLSSKYFHSVSISAPSLFILASGQLIDQFFDRMFVSFFAFIFSPCSRFFCLTNLLLVLKLTTTTCSKR